MMTLACEYSYPMKVIKPPPPPPPKASRPGKDVYSVRLDNQLVFEIDRMSRRAGVSRNRFIEAILKQALNDPKFVLRLP